MQTSTCYASIQSAINAAGSGNTINIGVGTYAEHLSIGTNLTLQGATNGSSIVDGSAHGTVLTAGTGATVTIVDLTIRNGSNSFGGGIENDSAGVLKLANVTISKNTASNGSGVYLNSGKSTIVNTILAGNTTGSSADCGSGYFLDFGGHNVLDANPNAGNCANLGNGQNDQKVADPLVNALGSNGRIGLQTNTVD